MGLECKQEVILKQWLPTKLLTDFKFNLSVLFVKPCGSEKEEQKC